MKHLNLYHRPFQDHLNDFTHYLKYLGYSAQSLRYLPLHLREFFYFLEQKGLFQLEALPVSIAADFQDYLQVRPHQREGGSLSKAYQNKYAQAINLFGRYLRQSRPELPWPEMAYQSEESEARRILSQAEIQTLYAACAKDALGLRDKAMLAIFYACGLRRSEGVALDCRDLHFRRKLLHVRKGKNYRERLVPIEGQVLADVQHYLLEGRGAFAGAGQLSAFFLSQKGRRISGQSLQVRLQKLCEAAGLPSLGLHSLRHSIATHLLESGLSLEHIAHFLGHRSLESTQIYTHIEGQ